MGHGLRAGTSGQSKLKRLARVQETCCKALSQGASHQTPQEVTNHDPPDAPIGLLKGNHAPQAKGRCDARWDSRLSQGGGSTNKRGTSRLVIQRQTAELRCVTGGAGSSSFPSPPQIAKHCGSCEHDRGLRLESQNCSIDGVVRLVGPPGGVL